MTAAPVKPSRATALALAALVALTVATAGCGYRALYGENGGTGGGVRYHVALVRSLVPDAVATDEVLAGVREQLARDGALADGDGYPRVEVEVLRADEWSEGVAARPPGDAANPGRQPYARGLGRGLVARGWVSRERGAPPERDTGDLRAVELLAVPRASASSPADATAALLEANDSARASARRLGHRIALRALGFPVPQDESAGVGR